ncbi:MAG: hypothetical protein GAK45_00493 [Pseudomonas citronellolis]|nr:MAG: hypothetical protein GAK45_00493 [Pseudomonas citronellolis]
MPDASITPSLLGDSYRREVCSLLYHAYRHEPTYAYLLDGQRGGYEQRVRATIREVVQRHMSEAQPVLGLLRDDRLLAVALIVPPQRRLDAHESWMLRLRLWLRTGLDCTRRYLGYHDAVLGCLPPGPYHYLPLIGVHPEFQGARLGQQLLDALHAWVNEESGSQGLVLDTGNTRYLDFYLRQGYHEVGQVALGGVCEHVLFHPAAAARGR